MAAIDLPDLRGKLRLDLSDLQRGPAQVRAAIARMQAAASGDPVKVPVEADDDDVAGGVRTARRVGQSEADRNPIDIPVRIDRRGLEALAQRIRDLRTVYSASLGPIRSFGTEVAKVATIAGLAATAISSGVGLVGGIFAFTSATLAAANAAPVLVSALTAVGAVTATLKIGLSGVGDALKEALGDSFKEVSPSAARFVAEIKKLTPELVGLRNAVQGRLFVGLGQEVRALGERYLPTLRRAAVAVAGELRGALGAAIRDLNTTTTQWRLAFVLDSARRSIALFAPQVARLPGLFLRIAEVAAPAFESIARAGAGAFGDLIDAIDRAASSGALAAGIQQGVQAVIDLGRLLGGVLGVLRGINTAATAVFGTSLVGQVAALATQLSRLVASAPGQEFLRGLFSEALPVIRQLGDLLVGSVLPGIGRLLPVVATLASAFLDGLAPVIPVAEALLTALGGALAAVLPAVSTLAQAFGGALTAAVTALAPVIPPLAAALASLLAPTGAFQAFVQAVAPVLPVIAEGFGAIVTAIGSGLGTFFTALAPLLPGMAEAFASLAAAVGESLAVALASIAPSLPLLAETFIQLAVALSPVLPTIIQAIADALVSVAPYLPGIAANLGVVVGALAQLTPAMASIIGAIAFALELVSGAAAFVAVNIPAALAGIGEGFAGLVGAVNLSALRIVTVFAGLPSATARHVGIMVGQVISTASRLGPALQAVGAGVVSGFVSALSVIVGRSASIAVTTAVRFVGGISSMPGRTAAIMGSVAANVASALGRAAGAAASGAGRVLSAISSTFSRVRGAVASALAGIPGAVASALAAAAGAAFAAGSRIPGAIASGIRSRIGEVVAAARAVAGAIAGLLPGSPVRYGPLRVLNRGYAGGQITQMLADGMLGNLAAATDAANRLAAASVPQATPAPAGAFSARAATAGPADDGRLDLSDRSLRALAALLQPAVYVDGVQQAVDRGLGGRFVTEMR